MAVTRWPLTGLRPRSPATNYQAQATASVCGRFQLCDGRAWPAGFARASSRIRIIPLRLTARVHLPAPVGQNLFRSGDDRLKIARFRHSLDKTVALP